MEVRMSLKGMTGSQQILIALVLVGGIFSLPWSKARAAQRDEDALKMAITAYNGDDTRTAIRSFRLLAESQDVAPTVRAVAYTYLAALSESQADSTGKAESLRMAVRVRRDYWPPSAIATPSILSSYRSARRDVILESYPMCSADDLQQTFRERQVCICSREEACVSCAIKSHPAYTEFPGINLERANEIRRILDISNLEVVLPDGRLIGDEITYDRLLGNTDAAENRARALELAFRTYDERLAAYEKDGAGRRKAGKFIKKCAITAGWVGTLVMIVGSATSDENSPNSMPFIGLGMMVASMPLLGIGAIVGHDGRRGYPDRPGVSREYPDEEIVREVDRANRAAYLDLELSRLPER
jgi:hypothetical protein